MSTVLMFKFTSKLLWMKHQLTFGSQLAFLWMICDLINVNIAVNIVSVGISLFESIIMNYLMIVSFK